MNLKRLVFRHLLKTVSDDASMTFCGRVFHSREAVTGKARSPVVEGRVCQKTGDNDKAEETLTGLNV